MPEQQTVSKSHSVQADARDRWLTWAVCGILVLAIALVFGQTGRFDFVNLDDDVCITGNPQITRGFTWHGIGWALTHRYFGNWDPVTWISHMADWQIYGFNAGGHHLTNVLLHAATAVLLFLVFRQMTGRLWPSALAAALFAVHPLRAESVAWVTERKDVLSGLFFVVTLAAYVRYARGPFSIGRYLAVVVFFTLALMAKPMVVTLPCVLLLLDYWPLEPMTTQRRGIVRLVLEKFPLLIVAAGCCAITIWAEGVRLHERLPTQWQVGNAVLSYVGYLWQSFYPANLSPLALRRGLEMSYWQVGSAAMLLLSITAAAALVGKSRPYLLVGWLWYLGMLMPVIGFVPFGTQAAADRFTYLPQIGICIALAWGIADFCSSQPYRRLVFGVASTVAIVVLAVLCWRQTSYWSDSVTLWTRAAVCTPNNYRVHNILGNALVERAGPEGSMDLGELDKAIAEYRKAIAIKPSYAEAHYGLAAALVAAGRFGEAIPEFHRAIKIQPDYAIAENDLGNALAEGGQYDEAKAHFARAVEIEPEFAKAHYNLGEVWWQHHRELDKAIDEYLVAVRLRPDSLEYRCRLAEAFSAGGQPARAIAEYRAALDLAIRQGDSVLTEQLRARIAQCQLRLTDERK